MTLKTRKPTGLVPWPLILVEGAEKSGKSWSAAELSTSDRVGHTFWIDLGEGAADEYGAIPGARYEIVEHDGTWAQIFGAISDVRDVAAAAAKVGDKPVVLVIDSMTAEWDLLKDWAAGRAKERLAKKGRRIEAGADVQISMDLWNDANGRHRKLMTILMTFPGIVVVTARGKEVAALDSGGRPIEGSKEYKVEGQKNLAFDASVWVRMSRDGDPQIIGARSVHAGVKPGSDKPRSVRGLTLDRLVFDVLKCNPSQAKPRDLVEIQGGSEEPEGAPTTEPQTAPAGRRQAVVAPKPSPKAVELFAAIGDARDLDGLKSAWDAVVPALSAQEITQAEADQLTAHVRNRKGELGGDNPTSGAPAGEASGEQRKRSMARMHAQWAELGLGGDPKRDERLAKTSALVGRAITSSNDLTDGELQQVITWQASEKKAEVAS